MVLGCCLKLDRQPLKHGCMRAKRWPIQTNIHLHPSATSWVHTWLGCRQYTKNTDGVFSIFMDCRPPSIATHPKSDMYMYHGFKCCMSGAPPDRIPSWETRQTDNSVCPPMQDSGISIHPDANWDHDENGNTVNLWTNLPIWHSQ